MAHPGVVRLIRADGDPTDELVTGWVDGGDLTRVQLDTPQMLAGIGAAVATTLADLHDLGLVHGAVIPAHILLDAGRPVLCGFGSARKPSSPAQLAGLAAEDTAALARMLLSRLPATADPRLRATLHVAAGQRGRSHRGDARRLARDLIRRVPGAHLPDLAVSPDSPAYTESVDPPTPFSPPRRPIARAAIAGVIAVGIAVAVLTLRPARSARAAAAVARCPAVDHSCRPVRLPDGVIATGLGRFRVSAPPHSIVVLGRWDCDGKALPAVAETSTGSVWLFDSWPGPGQSRAARLVAQVREVSGLKVIPTPDGCDLLRITRTGGDPFTIRPSRT
jgi:serine/threonine protein kinase